MKLLKGTGTPKVKASAVYFLILGEEDYFIYGGVASQVKINENRNIPKSFVLWVLVSHNADKPVTNLPRMFWN